MVRPARFGYNAETAANNYFQQLDSSPLETAHEAIKEFDAYVDLLRKNGVDVTVIQDTDEPPTPDSIFPNNWFTTHITGELIFYPMFAENRRQERKPGAKKAVEALPFITRTIDLTHFEEKNLFLEGTGSMTLDRVNKLVYCCSSKRSAVEVLDEFCKEMDYKPIYFDATDIKGQPIYHTNVMMAIATEYAVVCLESIRDEEQQMIVTDMLAETGHFIIPISLSQVEQFAGNMLEIANADGESLLLMSAAAFRSLSKEQISIISKYSRILSPELGTIERIGGGSARCMVAELFYPEKEQLKL